MENCFFLKREVNFGFRPSAEVIIVRIDFVLNNKALMFRWKTIHYFYLTPAVTVENNGAKMI